MRIRMMADGRVLEGTAKQIAEAMHALAFGQENRTLSEYIDWAVDQARRMNEIDLEVTGTTDDDKASALVRAMLAAGLAQNLKTGPSSARFGTTWSSLGSLWFSGLASRCAAGPRSCPRPKHRHGARESAPSSAHVCHSVLTSGPWCGQ